jgi:hypothetical protein
MQAGAPAKLPSTREQRNDGKYEPLALSRMGDGGEQTLGLHRTQDASETQLFALPALWTCLRILVCGGPPCVELLKARLTLAGGALLNIPGRAWSPASQKSLADAHGTFPTSWAE